MRATGEVVVPASNPEGAPAAALLGLRGAGRGARHLVIGPGWLALVRAKRVSPANAVRMSVGQLRTADPSAVVIPDEQIVAADVWQCPIGGQVTITRRHTAPIALTWIGRANKAVDAEGSLGTCFRGRVDQVSPDPRTWARFFVPRLVAIVVAVIVVSVGGTVLGSILAGDPPPKQAVAGPAPLSAEETAIRDSLGQTCPAWQTFASSPRWELPTQEATRAVVDAVSPHLVAAASLDPALGPSEAELAWLGGWAVRPAEEASRESLARIRYSMEQVSLACQPRA
ncbi:MAG: hypothetical protein ACR2H3_07730 [Acidimicrobiales bacterium]